MCTHTLYSRIESMLTVQLASARCTLRAFLFYHRARRACSAAPFFLPFFLSSFSPRARTFDNACTRARILSGVYYARASASTRECTRVCVVFYTYYTRVRRRRTKGFAHRRQKVDRKRSADSTRVSSSQHGPVSFYALASLGPRI